MSAEYELLNKGLVYLASPYSRYPHGPRMAFEHVCALAGKLLNAGVRVYSPIAHTHPIAIYGGLDPLDHTIWLPFDEAIMARSDALAVAMMDGWRDSVGVAHEVEFFRAAQKPVYTIDPQTLAAERFKE